MANIRRINSHAAYCAALALMVGTANAQPASTQMAAPPAIPGTSVQQGLHVARVILLGTGGGPRLRSKRAQISSVLLVDGRPYLIDVGAGVVARLTEAGIDTRFIERLFITHLHSDHYNGILEFQSFISTDRGQNNLTAPPVQIFGPKRTKFIVENSLRTFSVADQIFGALQNDQGEQASDMFTTTELEGDGEVYSDGVVKVTAVRNTHFDNFSKDSVSVSYGDASYSYRFDTPAGSIVFTGDTGCSVALEKLSAGADLLVSEVTSSGGMTGGAPGGMGAGAAGGMGAAPAGGMGAAPAGGMGAAPTDAMGAAPAGGMGGGPSNARGCWGHMSSEQVGELASRANVGAVLLNHLVPGLDDEKDMSIYTVGAMKHFKGPVIPGHDLFEYNLVKSADK